MSVTSQTPPPPPLDVGKILDLIGNKETQYYALWAVYTAVQFSAGSYGLGQPLPLGIACAVLAGVWAFNVGHLLFVLHCLQQINFLKRMLTQLVGGDRTNYDLEAQRYYKTISENRFRLRPLIEGEDRRSYVINVFTHIFIDICASIALMGRALFPGSI